VKSDVELVWKNCYKYNSRPVDQSTRDLCAEVQRVFEARWAKAGVGEGSSSPDSEVGETLIIEVGEGEVPPQYDTALGESLGHRWGGGGAA